MRQRQSMNGLGLVLVALLVLFVANSLTRQRTPEDLTQQAYMQEIIEGDIEKATIHQNKETPTGEVILTMKDQSQKRVYVSDVQAERTYLLENHIPVLVEDVPHENYILTLVLPVVLSGVVLVVVFMMMNARAASGGANARMMNFGKSRAKLSRDANKFNFKKVAGLQEEKEDLEELVDFLRSPQKYTSVGARIPKGVLLVGSPGTGKTLLAKAVAGESGVPFFSISGSDFVEMFVGVGASRVRDS